MFKHNYLKGALERKKAGKFNYKDRFYKEIFRVSKDFSQWPSSISLDFSYFDYILDNYEKTVLDREKYFCLCVESSRYPDYLWLMACLRELNIHTISFKDLISKKVFLAILERQVKERGVSFPAVDLGEESREVLNVIEEETRNRLFRVFP